MKYPQTRVYNKSEFLIPSHPHYASITLQIPRLALVFCLLPHFGLKAQTPTTISFANGNNQISPYGLLDGEDLTIESDGRIVLTSPTSPTSGVALTGAGNNEINNAGMIISDDDIAIVLLGGGNTITNSGTITAGTGGEFTDGISLEGAADATMLAAQAIRPAYDATDTDRDAYYFNNKVINNAGGVITGKDLEGSGIFIDGARVQILNTGGTITAEGGGNGVYFYDNSGQGFVYNTGSITAATGFAITAESGVDAITIHNTGTISSTSGNAIVLQSLNLIVNSGAITGGINANGILLSGAAGATMLTNNPTAPAYDTTDAALRDAYYFNNKVVNEVVGTNTGTITGKGTGHGIAITGTRAQILNTGGDIVAEGSGHGIHFATGSGQGFVYNTGSITAASGNAIAAADGVNEITIHNTGTIESTTGVAIVLQSLNLIVNSGAITGPLSAIWLQGVADPTMLANNPTAPAYDTTDAAARDAYYFNNKVINNTGSTITVTGAGHGIVTQGARTQILNSGNITAEGIGARGIIFHDGSSQGFLYNAGSISSRRGHAISIAAGVNEITIHNTGTIESVVFFGILLQNLNLVVNSGDITGSAGVYLAGFADPAMLANNPTAPAYDATDAARDAYYFNNKVVNEIGGTITGTANTGGGIYIVGARAQIFNHGEIVAEITRHGGIIFTTNSSQNFVYNTGSISAALGSAILAVGADNGEITIHNDTGGTLSSTTGTAVALQSLNLIVNSGDITAGTDSDGIHLQGAALQATLTANPTAPAWDAAKADRDDYYFNNTIINEVGGVITGKGTDGHGIHLSGKRAQIINHGEIVAEGTGHGIYFAAGSGESIVVNTGTISSDSGWGIYADDSAGNIVVINGGTITGGLGAIHLSGADDTLVIRRGSNITGNVDFGDGTDELIYAGAETSGQLATHTLSNLETTNTVESTSDLGVGVATVNAAETSIQALAADEALVIKSTGGIITTGIAVTGADSNTITNNGTISSTANTAIWLQSLNLIVNSGDITSRFDGIHLSGTAEATEVANNPTAPAYAAAAARFAPAALDAYYFNNKVINEAGGTITGKGSFGDGITITGTRAQILNTGVIIAERSGLGISFSSTSGQSFVYNAGRITSALGAAISGFDAITIHNDTGGTIGSTAFIAIWLGNLNFIVNSGYIRGASIGIYLSGAADPDTITANPTAPAYNGDQAPLDAYYFNNKIINERGGAIVGQGNAHAIRIDGKRAQIFNHGDIFTEGSGHGIYFGPASGESLVVNTGTIRSTRGWGIYAHDDVIGITVINRGDIIGGAGAVYLNRDNNTLIQQGGASGAVEPDTTNELVYAPDSSAQFAPSTEPEVTTDPTTEPPANNEPAPKVAFATEQDDSSSSSINYQSLFALSDELILDLNASIQGAIYEHNFSLINSERKASEYAPKRSSWWTQAFVSLRTQDASDDNAKADHTLGGVLIGYDLAHKQGKGIGFFLGAALGALDTDDDAELTSQSLFGGANFKFTKDKLFYGFNFTAGFTSHKSERSVEESGETVNIKGDYTGFFLSPEFIIGMKSQMGSVNITPSLRVRYSLALLGEYEEDGDAESRISVEKRNTGTIESRAQVAFPLGLASQTWSFEPRLGLAYRADLNKDTFDVETLATETPIDYDAEKENTLGFFGGLGVEWKDLEGNTNFQLNVDVIHDSESFLVLRAQAGFGFGF